jgi:hypothetical protein
MIDPYVKSMALQVRFAIEANAGGDLTGPAVLELVQALGGNPHVLASASANGKHQLVATYLLALVLTQPD